VGCDSEGGGVGWGGVGWSGVGGKGDRCVGVGVGLRGCARGGVVDKGE
jgi:hypothetical protein